MDSDPCITVERLRRQLDDIRRQIESLKDERVNVEELERTVSSVVGAIEDIYPAGESDDNEKFNRT
jgi:prefoldin subunit 5